MKNVNNGKQNEKILTRITNIHILVVMDHSSVYATPKSCWMFYVTNSLNMIKICHSSTFKVYKVMNHWGNTTLCIKTEALCIWCFSAFWKKICCLCYIKISCSWYYIMSLASLAFFTMKKALYFVRNFLTPSFASAHVSTSWFPMKPIRYRQLLNKEGTISNKCHIWKSVVSGN